MEPAAGLASLGWPQCLHPTTATTTPLQACHSHLVKGVCCFLPGHPLPSQEPGATKLLCPEGTDSRGQATPEPLSEPGLLPSHCPGARTLRVRRAARAGAAGFSEACREPLVQKWHQLGCSSHTRSKGTQFSHSIFLIICTRMYLSSAIFCKKDTQIGNC